MIHQLFGMVVIVFFTVASLITAPTPVNAAGFQDQSTFQSNQGAQEDQYAEQEQNPQGNRYSQEEQTFPAQDSEYSSPNNQAIQSNDYDQTREQQSSQNS